MTAPFTFKMAIGAPTHLPLTRREVVDHITQLMDLLDKMDGDPDDEPSLGWAGHGTGIALDRDSPRDDREDDAGDNGEMDDDREWSLGSLETVNQTRWSMGASGGDLEGGRV